MTYSGTIGTIFLFRNERYEISRPKTFDREKAQSQALQLFWRKGYTATSIEDLVEALHLSRSSLYDTFGDKRTLFVESLKLYSERVIGRIARTLNEASSPIAGIQAVFDELTAGVGSDTGDMGCFMVNSVAELVPYDPEVAEIAARYTGAVEQLFAEALTHAAGQEVTPSKQAPEQLAVYVFNVMQGIRILIKSGATREQIQAICTITLASLA